MAVLELREGTKSLIFHVMFMHSSARHCGHVPITFAIMVEARKLWDPQGICTSNVIVSITDHTTVVLLGDPERSPSKIIIEVHYVKYVEIKVMTQHFCLST